MAVPFDTPVSAIEGVGPAAEQLLQARGVYTVYDLLRAQSTALHGAVATLASLQEVKAWRQMAVLLEVAAVTPQWAEALVKAGVTALAELRRLDLYELNTQFTTARDQGVIPSIPSTEDMVAMLTDASLLDYAGAITGTVKDHDGNPVINATVYSGARQVTTDGLGRFRLLRLMLGSQYMLRMEKPGLHTTTAYLAPLPTAIVEVIQLVMPPEIATRPRPSGLSSGRLSELDGDILPQMQGQSITSDQVPVTSLRTGDLLLLTELYANRRDAKLVSKLLEYDGSRFVVHWSWLPKADLPGSADVGDCFLRTSSGFRKIKMNPRKLNEYKKLQRMKRLGPSHPPAASLEENYHQAAETYARMGEWL